MALSIKWKFYFTVKKIQMKYTAVFSCNMTKCNKVGGIWIHLQSTVKHLLTKKTTAAVIFSFIGEYNQTLLQKYYI